jgi:hypothetical protein
LSSRFWPTFFDRVGLDRYFRGRLDAFLVDLTKNATDYCRYLRAVVISS